MSWARDLAKQLAIAMLAEGARAVVGGVAHRVLYGDHPPPDAPQKKSRKKKTRRVTRRVK